MNNNFEKFRNDNSSTISMARYYADTKKLTLIYKSGGVYEYEDVPLFYWRGLLDAESKGNFINTNIKRLFKFNKK
jgi:hypothetical protein